MRLRPAALALALILGLAAPAAATADSAARFHATVDGILAQPYQPDSVPTGTDSAFVAAGVVDTAPAEDYTTGSIPGSPDAPAWPPWFTPVSFTSGDGAPLFGELAVHAGTAPGVVVVHGFNTHGYASVIRWAAMMYANGYDVLAADQRDYSFEYYAGVGYPSWQQTFGWKEAQDVLAAGRYLDAQKGMHGKAGLVGFSEGGQNTVLALALDHDRQVFAAGLQFSGPADQDTQIYSTAVPAGCASPVCTYPSTDALVALVVPPFEAQMMAGYEVGNPIQATYEVTRGEHAYFFDRWWQQRAILLYFKAMLPEAQSDPAVTTTPTVQQTLGGLPFGDQLVPLAGASRAATDALLAPYVCDTTRGVPGLAGG